MVASIGDLKLDTLLGVLVVMLYPLRTPLSGLKVGLTMPSLVSLSLDLSCSSCCLILLERFLTTGRPVTVAALNVDWEGRC